MTILRLTHVKFTNLQKQSVSVLVFCIRQQDNFWVYDCDLDGDLWSLFVSSLHFYRRLFGDSLKGLLNGRGRTRRFIRGQCWHEHIRQSQQVLQVSHHMETLYCHHDCKTNNKIYCYRIWEGDLLKFSHDRNLRKATYPANRGLFTQNMHDIFRWRKLLMEMPIQSSRLKSCAWKSGRTVKSILY